jgi:hypothetical protein
MKKLLYIENLVDEKSSKLSHAVEIAKAKGLELSALFVIPVHMDVTDWIEVQEKHVKEAESNAKRYAEKMEAELKDQGEIFKWAVVRSMPDALMKSLEAFTPVDVIMAGKIDLAPLSEKGIKNLEHLSSRFGCPVFPVESLIAQKSQQKGVNLFRFLAFAALSAVSYFVFFPHLDKLNHLIFMKGTILGGIAVMVVVPLHAYVYGSFAECITQFIGLEKSMNSH